MNFACLFVTLVTAAGTPASDTTNQPVLLDFHAQWCGPCQKMRRVVAALTEQGYPVKSIDIDREPELRNRYHVQEVPTFIVVDGAGQVLDRTKGLQPAAELVRFYKAAVARAEPPSNSNAHVGAGDDARGEAGNADKDSDPSERRGRHRDDDSPAQEPATAETEEPAFVNPKPWETVVRIRVMNARSIGFGSGTIIESTPEESIILTCAHIFKLDGRRQAPPAQFPRQIMVDLFDGNLRGTKPAQVHCIGSVEGKALDYDFKRDVGLIRIRPGRRLPAARVVPAHWQPKARMIMMTVGCSEGHDATAWKTLISRARMQGFLAGNNAYEAIECQVAPKEGRSGGGLFTTDGYVAGVCNFAEPQGDHGLYATPRSIYSVLDRNGLMALYAPVQSGSGTILADRGPGAPPPRTEPISIARSQSPDKEAPIRKRRRAEAAGDQVMIPIPPPAMVGIADPVPPGRDATPEAAAAITRGTTWQPSHDPDPAPDWARARRPEPTDLNLDPAADADHFGPPPASQQAPEAASKPGEKTPSGVQARTPGKPYWRAVKADAGASGDAAH
jgi:thiol-disulfide isomerase/thioredoxin